MQIKENDYSFFITNEEATKRLAYLTFEKEENILTITHIVVDEALRGGGVAKGLFEHAINYARENDLKIVPICPYAVAQFKKSRAYDDVLAVTNIFEDF